MSGLLATDLEAPGVLATAARSLVNAHSELILLATGPDNTSLLMTNNTLANIASVGLRKHVLVMADSWDSCQRLARPCYWSSRVLNLPPSESVANDLFWDWRFRFYYVKSNESPPHHHTSRKPARICPHPRLQAKQPLQC